MAQNGHTQKNGCKLGHVSLWEYSYERLKLAQRPGRHSFLSHTLRSSPSGDTSCPGEGRAAVPPRRTPALPRESLWDAMDGRTGVGCHSQWHCGPPRTSCTRSGSVSQSAPLKPPVHAHPAAPVAASTAQRACSLQTWPPRGITGQNVNVHVNVNVRVGHNSSHSEFLRRTFILYKNMNKQGSTPCLFITFYRETRIKYTAGGIRVTTTSAGLRRPCRRRRRASPPPARYRTCARAAAARHGTAVLGR